MWLDSRVDISLITLDSLLQKLQVEVLWNSYRDGDQVAENTSCFHTTKVESINPLWLILQAI